MLNQDGKARWKRVWREVGIFLQKKMGVYVRKKLERKVGYHLLQSPSSDGGGGGGDIPRVVDVPQ